MKITRILLGYDGTEPAREAAHFTGQIARRLGAPVTVLSTGYMVVAVGTMVIPATDTSAFLPIASEGAAIVRSQGVEAEPRPVLFDPATVLSRTAVREGYDLIVVGHRRLAGILEHVLGSVARKLASQATIPVLVVRDVAPETVEKVLVAVDGSPHARRAAEATAVLAGALEAHATLVHVIDSTVLQSVPRETDIQQGRQELARVGRDALTKAANIFRRARVPYDTIQVEGRPADVIVETARSGGYELVAVGRRGVQGTGAAQLGSVSDLVLRDGSPLVLIAGAPDERQVPPI